MSERGNGGFTVCPAAVVDAPADRVWELVSRPDGLALWVDANLQSATPTGPARPRQRMTFTARAMGRGFPIIMTVSEADPERYRLGLAIDLPFGVRNDEVITITTTSPRSCVVRFG